MARNSQSGSSFIIDTRALTRLARDLRRVAPEAYMVGRTRWRAAVQVVADDAKSRASFSKRIPGTVKVMGTGFRLKLVAGGEAAPDAAPLENHGREGTFRHPVFGTDKWVEQKARPFLGPAVTAHLDWLVAELERSIRDAMDGVLR